MTLQVSFEEFVETVKRLLEHDEAYVSPHSCGTLVTSAKAEKTVVIASISPTPPDGTISVLKERGFKVFTGTWLTPEEVLAPDLTTTQSFVAAVAYRSGNDKPGVWVDAFPTPPTQVTVLKAMYDEFRQTGEMEDVPFEEFVNLANPNVVIVTPNEMESFLRQKEDC